MSNSAVSSKSAPTRRALRLVALMLLAGAAGFWTAKGAHRGWSMDQVPVKQTDEITGIEYVTYEKRFVPGVEFLGGAAVVATGFFVLSFFIRPKTNNPTS